MNFAREGLLFIVIASRWSRRCIRRRASTRRSWPLWLLAFVVTVIALWVAYFFRDPERTDERGAMSSSLRPTARSCMITEVDEPRSSRGARTRISIFMNVFNVHVNRYPVDGSVDYVWYNKGKFLNAAAEKSSLENEQMSVGIEPRVGLGSSCGRSPA